MVFKENTVILKYILFVACKLTLQCFRSYFGTLVCISVHKQCGFWLIIFKKAEFKVGWVGAWNLGVLPGEWRACLHVWL